MTPSMISITPRNFIQAELPLAVSESFLTSWSEGVAPGPAWFIWSIAYLL
jgi:hypothetical protein